MSPTPFPDQAPSANTVSWDTPQRHALFDVWFAGMCAAHGLAAETLRPASSDASFRRYLRVDVRDPGAAASRIIMDAPPQQSDCRPFVQVAELMTQAGLKVPHILAWDEPDGFMLLSDLGPQTMLQVMQGQTTPSLGLYLDAVETLVQWQLASREGVLSPYDQAFVLRELELFPQWYVAEYRQFTLDQAQRQTLDAAFAAIARNNLAWPKVFMHRDFMPRNLMVADVAASLSAAKPSATRLGVLDFQDAVYGPITYDIASLMRDAFISWDEDFCLDVTIRYWSKARKEGLPVGDDFGEFYKGVEWMGLQRHLKIAGIFARLSLRDGKPQYLADTPRFIAYIRATCTRYMELKPLLRLVEKIEGIPVPNAYAFGRT